MVFGLDLILLILLPTIRLIQFDPYATVNLQRFRILEPRVLMETFCHLEPETIPDMFLAIFTAHWA